MMNIHKFLDEKHGFAIGRVYMLILLFFFNLLIPVGAVQLYLYAASPALLILGLAGTALVIAVLSTPVRPGEK